LVLWGRGKGGQGGKKTVLGKGKFLFRHRGGQRQLQLVIAPWASKSKYNGYNVGPGGREKRGVIPREMIVS